MNEAAVWEQLSNIKDPEIPVLSLVEMKVIRSVEVRESDVKVQLAPTFVGCPAIELMKKEIRQCLMGLGFPNVEIELSLSPPWSTDLLGEDAKEKLRAFGIAPPPVHGESLAAVLELPVACPFCKSTKTRLESAFGATLCKQIHFCEDCRQAFERFKPV